MPRSCSRSPAVDPSPGIRSSGPRSSWASLPGNRSTIWPSARSATARRFGGFAAATRTRDCPASWHHHTDPGGLPGFPPLQRAEIVRLACLAPIAKGLHITHWTSQDLARQAVADGIVSAISDRTIRRILDEVDLQPHRTRYWKTVRLDAEFKDRAEQILWCYAQRRAAGPQGLLTRQQSWSGLAHVWWSLEDHLS